MLDFNDKLKPCGGSVKGQVYRIPRPAPFLSVFLTGIYFRLIFLSGCFYWF